MTRPKPPSYGACAECGTQMRARGDKRFCSRKCRDRAVQRQLRQNARSHLAHLEALRATREDHRTEIERLRARVAELEAKITELESEQ
jgi:hypothetical protein